MSHSVVIRDFLQVSVTYLYALPSTFVSSRHAYLIPWIIFLGFTFKCIFLLDRLFEKHKEIPMHKNSLFEVSKFENPCYKFYRPKIS